MFETSAKYVADQASLRSLVKALDMTDNIKNHPARDSHGGHSHVWRTILPLSIIFLVLAVLTVFLRFTARLTRKAGIGPDDLLILAGLVIFSGYVISSILWVHPEGVGLPLSSLTTQQQMLFLKYLFALEILSTCCFAAIKTSILFLYSRLIPSRGFQISCLLVGILIFFWWLAAIIALVLQCTPVRYLWDTTIVTGRCSGLYERGLAITILNMVFDIVILLLPMPIVWRQRCLERRKKIELTCIFLLGGFVCVVGLIRVAVASSFKNADPSETITGVLVWTIVEGSTAITCGCVIVMYPLVGGWLKKAYNLARCAQDSATVP